MKTSFVAILLFISSLCSAQKLMECPGSDSILVFTRSEQEPVFGKNYTDLQKFFDTSSSKLGTDLTGDVNLRLVVGKDGYVCGLNVSSIDIKIDPNKIKELILSMPAWNPAMQNQRKVYSMYGIRLKFQGSSVTVVDAGQGIW
jgi:hypothetical protein